MSNLALRLLTAAVLVPVLIVGINWSNPLGVFLLVFTASSLALMEFATMTLPAEPASERNPSQYGPRIHSSTPECSTMASSIVGASDTRIGSPLSVAPCPITAS